MFWLIPNFVSSAICAAFLGMSLLAYFYCTQRARELITPLPRFLPRPFISVSLSASRNSCDLICGRSPSEFALPLVLQAHASFRSSSVQLQMKKVLKHCSLLSLRVWLFACFYGSSYHDCQLEVKWGFKSGNVSSILPNCTM